MACLEEPKAYQQEAINRVLIILDRSYYYKANLEEVVAKATQLIQLQKQV
jgi:hypothetical protein